jgi:hypothetical protein
LLRAGTQSSEASRFHRLLVSIASTQIGPFQEYIEVKTSSARRPTIRIPVSGEVVGTQTIVPKRLLLPATPCGSLVSMRFLIHAALSAPPHLDAITCRNLDWEVTDWKLSEASPGNHVLTVNARVPSVPGYARTEIILSGLSTEKGTELFVSCLVGKSDAN